MPDDPAPLSVNEFVALMFGAPMPEWQAKIVERVVAGEQVSWSRKSGRATVHRAAREYDAYLYGWADARRRSE